jgi:hypothetical protein
MRLPQKDVRRGRRRPASGLTKPRIVYPRSVLLDRLRGKYFETWVPGFARHLGRDVLRPKVTGPRHLLFAICDHYEPRWKNPSPETAEERVRIWEDDYPKMADGFRDADGFTPRHSFFFPSEEYSPTYLDRLARMARRGYGEVEIHLHHDADTEAGLRANLAEFIERLVGHGHLSRTADGSPRYAFIHGNWALANGRRDRRWCGVDAELPLLFETGCYADFTFPSVPSDTQPNMVNQIYWPTGDLSRPRSYERGERAKVGVRKDDRILLITGPLTVWKRPGKKSLWIETGDLTGMAPPDPERVRAWAFQNIHVEGRPEWVFVKVHKEREGSPRRAGEGDAPRADDALQRRPALDPPLRDRARGVQHRERGDGRKDG